MSLSAHMGRPAKEERLIIGAVIIKRKLCLSDEESNEQIRENPYLQYFVGFKAFHKEQDFALSLFVEIRRRMSIISVGMPFMKDMICPPRWKLIANAMAIFQKDCWLIHSTGPVTTAHSSRRRG